MVDRERLLDLLAEWEERRQLGETLVAEQLCPGDPSMQSELAAQLRKRLRIQAALEPPAQASEVALPAVPGHVIEGVLGAGGMGVVYRARQKALGRAVAVKMMLGPLASDSCQRFRAEALALASLQHPHIVQVFEAGEADGRLYLVMEYAPGGSLAQQLRGVPLRWRRAAEIVALLADAVQHAHEHGVIHRDLKPANVLLDEQGHPKVADFGLAKLLGSDSGQTASGAIMGTPSYMSPEQARGSKDVGPTADVYSLGAILYEMLTGRPPFQGESALQTIMQVANEEPVPPARLNSAVPADLETVCLKCLQKSPADRYATAGALAADLRRVLAGEPTLARPLSQFDLTIRAFRRIRFDPGFRGWIPLTLALSPIPMIVAAIATFLFAGRPDAPYLLLLTVAGAVLVTQFSLFLGNRRVMEVVPEAERSRLNAIWNGVAVAMPVVLAIVWMTTPTDQPGQLLVAFPLWIALAGLAFAAQSADAGVMYAFSAYAFGVALLAAWLLPWSPLITGMFMTLNLLLISLFMWSVGRGEA